MIAAIVVSLVVGAVATSLAEYKLQYNLFDYIVEGFKKVFGYVTKAELKFKAEEDRIEAEVQRRVKQASAVVGAVEKKL